MIQANVSTGSKKKLPARAIATKFLEIDPNFVLEVATGLEELEEIAPRFGYSPVEIKALYKYKPFWVEVEKVKSELFKSGKTFRLKAGVMADQILEKVFEDALREDTGTAQRLESLKTLAKLADLEPKNNANVQQTGSGFSININLGGPKPEIIEVKQ